ENSGFGATSRLSPTTGVSLLRISGWTLVQADRVDRARIQRRSDAHQPLSLFQPLKLFRRKSRDAVGCTPDRPSHRANRINIATTRCYERASPSANPSKQP